MKTLFLLAALLVCGCTPPSAITSKAPGTVHFSGEGTEYGATLFFYETNGVRLAVLVGYKKCAMVQIK